MLVVNWMNWRWKKRQTKVQSWIAQDADFAWSNGYRAHEWSPRHKKPHLAWLEWRRWLSYAQGQGRGTCVERFSNKGEDRGHRCLFWWRCQPWRRQEGQEQSMCRVAHPGCWDDKQTDWLAMEDSRWGCTCCGWWGDNHWSWADGGNWSCQSGHVPDEDTGKVEFDLDGNLVVERQRRKKKDKRTKNTDDENDNDIARCDEGRR